MDRNQIIGFTLIGVLFMVYIFFFGPDPKAENKALINDSTAITRIIEPNAVAQDTLAAAVLPDSVLNKQFSEKYGIFAAGGAGKEEELVLENKNIQVTLSTKGGNVKKVLLKNYLTYDKRPLYLADENSSKISLLVSTSDNRDINLNELYFTGQVSKTGDSQSAVFRLPLADG
jgi:YidC/Oxa1 family membrane protein insertase